MEVEMYPASHRADPAEVNSTPPTPLVFADGAVGANENTAHTGA